MSEFIKQHPQIELSPGIAHCSDCEIGWAIDRMEDPSVVVAPPSAEEFVRRHLAHSFERGAALWEMDRWSDPAGHLAALPHRTKVFLSLKIFGSLDEVGEGVPRNWYFTMAGLQRYLWSCEVIVAERLEIGDSEWLIAGVKGCA